MQESTLEMLTEIVQGLVAVMLVAILGIVSVIEALHGQPFVAPATVASLAGAAVGFYYGQRGQRKQQQQVGKAIDALAEQVKNGSGANGK